MTNKLQETRDALDNALIYVEQSALDLDTPLPEKTKIILTPQQQKLAPVVELRRVK